MKRLRLLALLVCLVAAPALAQTATPQPGVSHEIAFAGGKFNDWGGGSDNIYLLNVDTGTMQNLTDRIEESYSSPAWSPDGKRLAFHKYLQGTDADYRLHVLDLESGNIKSVVDEGWLDSAPIWSMDGTKLYFVAILNRNDGVLYTVNTSDFTVERLDTQEGMIYPVISPDGLKLVGQITSGLATLSLANGTVVDLTDITQRDECCDHDWYPVWSPDGSQIAFESNREGQLDIYLMNPDGSQVQRLIDSPNMDTDPFWWPDGKRLGFVSYRNGNHDIYSLKLDDMSVFNLTHNDLDSYSPVLSPDGTHIIFEQRDDYGSDLYIMDSDGNNIRKLTNGEFDGIGDVAWRPVPAASGE